MKKLSTMRKAVAYMLVLLAYASGVYAQDMANQSTGAQSALFPKSEAAPQGPDSLTQATSQTAAPALEAATPTIAVPDQPVQPAAAVEVAQPAPATDGGGSPTSAQALNAEEKRKLEKDISAEDYRAALPMAERAVAAAPDDPNTNFQLGMCYLGLGRGDEAYTHLIKARDGFGKLDPTVNYLIGRSQQQAAHFDDAIASYEAYLKDAPKKDLDGTRAEAIKHLRECETGRRLVADPIRATIENVGSSLNSPYPEYTPVITADNAVMYFTSRRTGSKGGKMTDKNLYYEDIYSSKHTSEELTAWTAPENLGSPVNGATHDAVIGLSADGQQMFMYRDEGQGDIFVTKRDGLNWTKPVSIGKNINSKIDNEPSVSISADSKTLYFSSNRKGGKGGLDIYVSQKQRNGEWGVAKNLGLLNTPADEDSPFIHPDGKTLYFSSRGHEGMGGYDIFRTTLQEDGSYSTPENVGYPINTPGEDIYFVLTADGRYGYYASEKPGGSGYTDIYRIFLPQMQDLDSAEGRNPAVALGDTNNGPDGRPRPGRNHSNARFLSPIILVKGVVKDDETGNPLAAKVVVVNNATGDTVSQSESNSATGEYLVVLPSGKNYGISINADGYLFNSDNFYLPDNNGYKEFNKNVGMKKTKSGAKIVLRNIFFDTDKSNLRKESTLELEKLVAVMKDNPAIKVEVSGHTDNTGGLEHNQTLSENRANSVVEYLRKHGIARERMIAAGYAFNRPIAGNDTPEGKQQNRRTEFEIK